MCVTESNPCVSDRFCLRKVLPHWLHYSRALSGAEAINALRPFYFAVHPDFFGQHPRERVNTYFLTYCLCLVDLPLSQYNAESPVNLDYSVMIMVDIEAVLT